MTALAKYEKLESAGLWRESPEHQRVEVYVSFGDTSLVIRDKHEEPLSHWSLPAIHRVNPGESPAVFSPTAEMVETLELDDEIMVEAIETVRRAIRKKRPHPGRLRLAIFAAITAGVLASVMFWLPDALARHTAQVVPFETRKQIGEAALARMTRLTGKTCSTAEGEKALRALEKRLLGDPRGRIAILRDGIARSISLPGGLILLNRSLVEDYDQPEVAASYVVIELLRRQKEDPLLYLLKEAGVMASLRLLTTGRFQADTLDEYVGEILTRQKPLPPSDQLITAFTQAGFPSSPLAYALDITGETTLPLIEADPFRNKTYKPILHDSDWLALQAICGN